MCHNIDGQRFPSKRVGTTEQQNTAIHIAVMRGPLADRASRNDGQSSHQREMCYIIAGQRFPFKRVGTNGREKA